jgi:hypothetical protein
MFDKDGLADLSLSLATRAENLAKNGITDEVTCSEFKSA